jgi:hypothetical protein
MIQAEERCLVAERVRLSAPAARARKFASKKM